jgi:hypothetical protein
VPRLRLPLAADRAVPVAIVSAGRDPRVVVRGSRHIGHFARAVAEHRGARRIAANAARCWICRSLSAWLIAVSSALLPPAIAPPAAFAATCPAIQNPTKLGFRPCNDAITRTALPL